jgi:hypothetical protein
MLIAAAMLFAPFAMQSGSAMAAMPADHHAQTTGGGHCEGQPVTGQDGKSADMPCCPAMCAAVAVPASAPVEPSSLARSVERPALAQFQHGFVAKLPTPPPRLA